MKKFIFLAVWLLFVSFSCKEEIIHPIVNIIPQPLKVEMKKGDFHINSETKLLATAKEEIEIAELLRKQIKQVVGIDLQIVSELPKKNFIQFAMGTVASKNIESYTLSINNQRVILTGKSANGLFYGLQTLYQILPAEIYSPSLSAKIDLMLPALELSDEPRFGYRGVHLDVSRHFFPVDFIKRYIDILAMHKMNVFHWHLVDDQGWRIEIKQYPKLTEIGSKRINREDLTWSNRNYAITGDTTYYEGYYTQEQIKEVVAYASERFITVIPEIEMPAHVMCAIAAYPQLSCKQEQIEVPSGGVWPITEIYCAGNDEVFTFLENVLSEVIELFPSKYIHIGGDEATKTNWKHCKKCQKRMKDENLANEHELQSYFIKRIEKFLSSNGKKLLGWDEILEGGLAPEATVMSWRGIEGGITAAQSGHDVIMTPVDFCYFDYYQGDKNTEPKAIGGYLPMERVYSYNPIPDELNAEEAKHILGIQANLWTEYMTTTEHVEYMLLPRLAAISEINWNSGDLKNWSSFKLIIEKQLTRYSAAGYNFSKSNMDDLGLKN